MGARPMTLDASRAVFARFGLICGKCKNLDTQLHTLEVCMLHACSNLL